MPSCTPPAVAWPLSPPWPLPAHPYRRSPGCAKRPHPGAPAGPKRPAESPYPSAPSSSPGLVWPLPWGWSLAGCCSATRRCRRTGHRSYGWALPGHRSSSQTHCSQAHSWGQGCRQAKAGTFQRCHWIGAVIGGVIGTGAMVARGAHTAKRRAAGGASQLFVPVDDTGVALQPELVITLSRIRQQARGQAVLGSVGFSDGSRETVVADHLQQRTEELFVRALRDSRDIDNPRGEQGGSCQRLGHCQQHLSAIDDQLLLGLEQLLSGTKGNHRAHKR